jgi:hypothetical protein
MIVPGACFIPSVATTDVCTCADPLGFLQALISTSSPYLIDPCIYSSAFPTSGDGHSECDDGVTYAIRSPDGEWVITWSSNWLTYEDGTKTQLNKVTSGSITFVGLDQGDSAYWNSEENQLLAACAFGCSA